MVAVNNVQSVFYRTLTPRQEELMQEFMKEEQEIALKGASQCKSHTFGHTVRDTVNRIKKFLKTDDTTSSK